MNVIMRDIDDLQPNVARIETSADIATVIGQAIGNIFNALANMLSGGLATADVAALEEELKEKEEQLKMMRWLLVGVIVVVIIILLMRKK